MRKENRIKWIGRMFSSQRVVHTNYNMSDEKKSSQMDPTECTYDSCKFCEKRHKIVCFDLKPCMLGTKSDLLPTINRTFLSSLKFIQACFTKGVTREIQNAFSMLLESASKLEPYLFSALSSKILPVNHTYDCSQVCANFFLLLIAIFAEFCDGNLLHAVTRYSSSSPFKATLYAQKIIGLRAHSTSYREFDDLSSDLNLAWKLLMEIIMNSDFDQMKNVLENTHAPVRLYGHILQESQGRSCQAGCSIDAVTEIPFQNHCKNSGMVDDTSAEWVVRSMQVVKCFRLRDNSTNCSQSCLICSSQKFNIAEMDKCNYHHSGCINLEKEHEEKNMSISPGNMEFDGSTNNYNNMYNLQKCMGDPGEYKENAFEETLSVDVLPKQSMFTEFKTTTKQPMELNLVTFLNYVKTSSQAESNNSLNISELESWLETPKNEDEFLEQTINGNVINTSRLSNGNFIASIFRSVTDVNVGCLALSDLDLTFFRHTTNCDCGYGTNMKVDANFMHLESSCVDHIFLFAAVCRSKLRPNSSNEANYRTFIETLPCMFSYSDALKICLKKAHMNIFNNQSVLLNGQPECWALMVIDILSTIPMLNLVSNSRYSLPTYMCSKMEIEILPGYVLRSAKALYFALIYCGKLTLAFMLRKCLIRFKSHINSVSLLKGEPINEESLSLMFGNNLSIERKNSILTVTSSPFHSSISSPSSRSNSFVSMEGMATTSKSIQLSDYLINHDWTPQQMAHTITLRDEQLFHSIQASEVIAWLIYPKDVHLHPNISIFIDQYDRITHLVRGMLLIPDQSKNRSNSEKEVQMSQRCKIVQNWLKTVDILIELNNFSSTHAILTALNCKKIWQLGWRHSLRDILEPYHAYFEPNVSYDKYLEKLTALRDTYVPCIPNLMFLMREMVQMRKISNIERIQINDVIAKNSTHHSVVSSDSETKINFRENIRIHRAVRDSFERFKTVHYTVLVFSDEAATCLNVSQAFVHKVTEIYSNL